MAAAGEPLLSTVFFDGDTPVLDLHSPSPPGDDAHCGNPEQLGTYQDTLQYDETQPIDDAFTLEGENFGNLASLAGETQLFDGAEYILDDCNEGVAVRTDSDEPEHLEVCLSDDEIEPPIRDLDKRDEKTKEIEQPASRIDSQKKPGSESVSLGFTEVAKAKPPLSLSSNSHKSASGLSEGCTRKGFTAIRSASLRAAGLAARSMSPHVENMTSCKPSGNSQDNQLKDCVKTPLVGFSVPAGEEVENMFKNVHIDGLAADKSRNTDNTQRNLKDNNKSARARKLFLEDTETDIEFHSMIDQNVAGLSYVDSQEPGESAQEFALNIVDKFLVANDVDSEVDTASFRTSSHKKKTPPSSMLKGPLNLAQRTNPGNPVQKGEVYDWVDSLEDERGGDFFFKKKEVLLRSGESSDKSKPEPRRQKHILKKPGIGKSLENEKVVPKINLPRLLPQNLKKVDNIPNKANKKKNVAGTDEELIDQLQNGPTRSNCMSDIGFDTQLAAEAMEALWCEPPTCEKVKEFCLSDVGQSNERLPLKNVSGKRALSSSDTRPAMRRSKRLRVSISPPKTTQLKGLSKKTTARKKKEGSEQGHVNSLSKSTSGKDRRVLPNRTTNKKTKLHVDPGSLEEGVIPVARRTRQSVRSFDDGEDGEGSNRLEGVIPVAHRARQSVGSISDEGTQRTSHSTEKIQDREFGHNKPKKPRSIAVVIAPISSDPRGESAISETCQKEVPDNGRKCKHVKRDNEKHKILKSPDREGRNETSDDHAGKRDVQSSVEPYDVNRNTWEGSLKDKRQILSSVNDASPVCMGDKSSNLLGKRGSSKSPFLRELARLDVTKMLPFSAAKSSRRRDLSNACVLLSNHLGSTMIKKLQKVMARLGIPAATSALDATHFVADEFVRTKNMLEAMALSKPVVTPLWLQRCGQASSFIDEKDFILRDHKKEKEIGFNMVYSLARASQQPLLQGKRVLITPNAKPNKELVAGLVKAVQGQPVERLGRSSLKDESLPDDLLIISCEEDYYSCVALLEKGVEAYDSELLLNGIVIQKLEYQRHKLFVDNVKKTRSTIWIKNGSDKQYRSVKRKML